MTHEELIRKMEEMKAEQQASRERVSSICKESQRRVDKELRRVTNKEPVFWRRDSDDK